MVVERLLTGFPGADRAMDFFQSSSSPPPAPEPVDPIAWLSIGGRLGHGGLGVAPVWITSHLRLLSSSQLHICHGYLIQTGSRLESNLAFVDIAETATVISFVPITFSTLNRDCAT